MVIFIGRVGFKFFFDFEAFIVDYLRVLFLVVLVFLGG